MITSVTASAPSLPTASSGCCLETIHNLLITAVNCPLFIGKKTIKILSNKFIIIPFGIIALSLVVYTCVKKIINFYRKERQSRQILKQNSLEQALKAPILERASERIPKINELIGELRVTFYSAYFLKRIDRVLFRNYLLQSLDANTRTAINQKVFRLTSECDSLEDSLRNLLLKIQTPQAFIDKIHKRRIGRRENRQQDSKEAQQRTEKTLTTEQNNEQILKKIDKELNEMTNQTLDFTIKTLKIRRLLEADNLQVVAFIPNKAKEDLASALSSFIWEWNDLLPALESLFGGEQ